MEDTELLVGKRESTSAAISTHALLSQGALTQHASEGYSLLPLHTPLIW